jgi:hypothetical protein
MTYSKRNCVHQENSIETFLKKNSKIKKKANDVKHVAKSAHCDKTKTSLIKEKRNSPNACVKSTCVSVEKEEKNYNYEFKNSNACTKTNYAPATAPLYNIEKFTYKNFSKEINLSKIFDEIDELQKGHTTRGDSTRKKRHKKIYCLNTNMNGKPGHLKNIESKTNTLINLLDKSTQNTESTTQKTDLETNSSEEATENENDWKVAGAKVFKKREARKAVNKRRVKRINKNNKIMTSTTYHLNLNQKIKTATGKVEQTALSNVTNSLPNNQPLINLLNRASGASTSKQAPDEGSLSTNAQQEARKRKLEDSTSKNSAKSKKSSTSSKENSGTTESKGILNSINSKKSQKELKESDSDSPSFSEEEREVTVPCYSNKPPYDVSKLSDIKLPSVLIKVKDELLLGLEKKQLETSLMQMKSKFKVFRYRVVYNKLYLDPCATNDSDYLMRMDTEFFTGCERADTSLEGLAFLIFNISANEITENDTVKSALIDLGIQSYTALNPKNVEARAVKCVAKDKKTLKAIFENHYGFKRGIRLLIQNSNKIVYGRVEPDGSNPRQCYNCFQLGHVKADCRAGTRCGVCAATNHSEDQCSNKGEYHKCVLCRENHMSTEHNACDTYKRARRLLADNIVSDLVGSRRCTSQAYTKVDPLKSFASVTKVKTDISACNEEIALIKADVSQLKNDETKPTVEVLMQMMKKVDSSIKSSKEMLRTSREALERSDEARGFVSSKCVELKRKIKNTVQHSLRRQREEYVAALNWHDARIKALEDKASIHGPDFKKYQEEARLLRDFEEDYWADWDEEDEYDENEDEDNDEDDDIEDEEESSMENTSDQSGSEDNNGSKTASSAKKVCVTNNSVANEIAMETGSNNAASKRSANKKSKQFQGTTGASSSAAFKGSLVNEQK